MKVAQRELTTDLFDDPMWSALRDLYTRAIPQIGDAERRLDELKREQVNVQRKLDSANKLKLGAELVAESKGWSLILSYEKQREKRLNR